MQITPTTMDASPAINGIMMPGVRFVPKDAPKVPANMKNNALPYFVVKMAKQRRAIARRSSVPIEMMPKHTQ